MPVRAPVQELSIGRLQTDFLHFTWNLANDPSLSFFPGKFREHQMNLQQSQ